MSSIKTLVHVTEKTTPLHATEKSLSLCEEIIASYFEKVQNLRGDRGTTVVRCCATNRKVAGSIPAGTFRSHYGPRFDSASNRNWYQEYFLGVKAAGA